jgi:hypothetical protein
MRLAISQGIMVPECVCLSGRQQRLCGELSSSQIPSGTSVSCSHTTPQSALVLGVVGALPLLGRERVVLAIVDRLS